MIANARTNPDDQTWSWEACSRGLSACDPFAKGRYVSTAGAPPHTVFRATSNYGAVLISPLWRGRVTSVHPPKARGPLRANELVTPVPGKWKGGWLGGKDWTQLSACKTLQGHGCTTLTDLHYPEACPKGAAVLDPVFTGQYLRVADMRLGPRPAMLAYAVGSPYGHEVWKRTQQTAVAIVGKILPASGPRTDICGAPPLSELPE